MNKRSKNTLEKARDDTDRETNMEKEKKTYKEITSVKY